MSPSMGPNLETPVRHLNPSPLLLTSSDVPTSRRVAGGFSSVFLALDVLSEVLRHSVAGRW